MNKLQSDSLSQYIGLLASDISYAARYLGCDKYEYKFTDKYYHIEINIKSMHYPDWYMTLSDALFTVGASGQLQTTIPNAFYNYGFKSLEEIKQYCEMFDYGNRPFRCYNNHKFPVSGIGKKSYYYLRKVMEKDNGQ